MQVLNLRATEGIGVGYQFYDNEIIKLFAEAGISNVNEDWNNMWSTRSSSVRTSIGFDSWFFGRILKVFHLDEVYIGTSSGMPVYITTAQGLRFRLGEISIQILK
jgi:hypothetical protein